MDTNPVTTFTRRAETVQDLFQPIGASPAVAADLFDADQRITEKLQELDQKVSGPTPEDLQAAGAAWAGGKGLSKVTAALDAPNVTGPRYAAIRKAAQAELVRRADNPEFAVRSLIESMAQDVSDYMTATAVSATSALDGLPQFAIEQIRTGAKRASNVDSLVDGRTTPTAEIDRLRDAAGVWSVLWDGAGVAAPRAAWSAMFGAIATGDASPHHGHALAEGSTGWWALWLPAKGLAALACGYKPETIILDEIAEFSPLSDPFGEDAEVYQHRVAAAGGVESMTAGMRDVIAAQARQFEPRMTTAGARKQSRGYTPLQRAGLGNPADALAEYLRTFPAYATDVDAEDQDATAAVSA